MLPQEARCAEVHHVQPRRYDVFNAGGRDGGDGEKRSGLNGLECVEAEEDRRDGVGSAGEDHGYGVVSVWIDGSVECGDFRG